MLSGQSAFSENVSVMSPKRPARESRSGTWPKCVSKTLSRGQRVAYEHIEDMLVIKSSETDNVN